MDLDQSRQCCQLLSFYKAGGGNYVSSICLPGVHTRRPQVLGSMAIYVQRFVEPAQTFTVSSFGHEVSYTFNNTVLGRVAYEITDLHDCEPWGNSATYLEAGARSRVFKAIQAVQFNVSLFAVFIPSCLGGHLDSPSRKSRVLQFAIIF